MSKFAWVTLTTNDTYSLGALVLAHSLKRVDTAHQLAVLVTPTVSDAMRDRLKDVYNVVQEVNVLDSQDAANLALLSRPELGVTFTKLHCWRLVQFEKCVFLDADTLVLKNCDELFEREELSAAPDVSWPDCFNSGVFVYRPSLETFNKITEYAVKNGSFDGGDQGLLNQFFGDWSTSDIKKHLPFIYNVTAYALYCYLPAFKQYRDKIKILHFAGKLKPWLIQFNSQTKTAATPVEYAHAQDIIQHWWNIFCDNVHESLSGNMSLCLNITTSTSYPEYNCDMDSYYHEQHHQQPHHQQQYVPQVREYRDPWADYYEQVERQLNEPEPRSEAELEFETQVHEERRRRWSDGDACRSDSPRHISPSHQPQNLTPPPPPASAPPTPQPTANEVNIAIDVISNEQSPPTATQHNDYHSENHHENHSEHHHEHQPTPPTNSDPSQAQEIANGDEVESNEAGLAGALSQLRIGVQRTPEQQQYEDLMRRQCWESGQIDYSGADSFDNIWKKIQQTLESKPDNGAGADQTDNDNDNANDNDNTLGYKQMLTQTASKLLQQSPTHLTAVPATRPRPSPDPSSSPGTSASSSSSLAINQGSSVAEVKASPAAATTNQPPTTNAQSAASSRNAVEPPPPVKPQRAQTAAGTTQQPQPSQPSQAMQPQHIVAQNVAPTKPSRQKATRRYK